MTFKKVAVLGPGLLGGSVGLAMQQRGKSEVCFWGRSEEKLLAVRKEGFFASTNLAEVVAGADLVILATPVEFYEGLAERLIEVGGEFLVTDVGSVKGAVEEGCGKMLRSAGISFVGSHPMAGSEQGGFAAARADLFEGATCFICAGEDEAKERSVENFWEELGCTVKEVTANEHDQIVARISHLPHALATVGAKVALREPGEGAYGGGGLTDTTRVAAGNPAMWTGILMGNRTAVLEELAHAAKELTTMRDLLENKDEAGLENWLERAKNLRDKLSEFQSGLKDSDEDEYCHAS